MARRLHVLHKKRLKALGYAKSSRPRRCEVCRSTDVLECCFVPWEKPHAYMCSSHAKERGFCAGCGLFWGGIESFDFGKYPGFCDHCQDQIDSDTYDEYEERDPWDQVDWQEVY